MVIQLLKFTKYVTNIIAELKYKYGQQEQVTVRNRNRTSNSKKPQQKYRLGTVSIKILGGLNRFMGTQPRPHILLYDKTIEL